MSSTKFRLLVILFLLSPVALRAQDTTEGPGYFTAPRETPYGTICSNNYTSAIYLIREGSVETLVSAPGAGSYYTLSFDHQRVGLKVVDKDGNQTPAILDLATRAITTLGVPAPRIGQASFSRDGRIAFTRGEQLIVLDGTKEQAYSLGTYANLAPLSPDGNSVAYNDDGDQIWLLNLRSGERARISDGKVGYFNPVWSPDGSKILYSSLNEKVRVYDLGTKQTYDLGDGVRPSWSENSRQIVFCRKQLEGPRLVNTDLFTSSSDGTGLRQLTSTPDKMEMDPSFTNGDSQVVFQTYSRRTIGTATVLRKEGSVQELASQREVILPDADHFAIKPISMGPALQNTMQLDIPYVHQAYDTPDWFNGDWACAPTEAIMVLAYYNILPPWPTLCSKPSLHYNNWGNYVSTDYQFREVQYNQMAMDAGSKSSWGGYGYMWTGSFHPYTRMANYFSNHGLSTIQTDATPHSVAYAEVSSGRPFNLCVMLTSAGHLVCAHGIGAEAHTFVFNDPWGDKNRGYPNYYGKNVNYDWPGYNNGYQNLAGVAWTIATTYHPAVPSDTMIDDLQFGHGFTMRTATPASMTFWRDKNTGYLGHAWYAPTRNGGSSDTCFATWTPSLPEDGVYEVSAYIPYYSSASNARYQITSSQGTVTKAVNQNGQANTWISLGSYAFTKGSGGSVRLGDASSVAGEMMGVDAIQWSRSSATTTGISAPSGLPAEFVLRQNYPNPFNPTTNIGFRLPAGQAGIADFGFVSLKVFDALGREVAVLVNEDRPAGAYTVQWDGAAFPSGVYYYRLQAGTFEASKKMILMK
jgi:Tol biopolymer transport system component